MRFVPTAVSRFAARTVLQTQKHSPQILFGTGIVLGVSATVMACKATLKLEEVVDNTAARQNKAQATLDDTNLEYDVEDYNHDSRIIRVQGAVAIVKLYMPAIITGGLAVAALTSSHRILSKRNAALGAAYAAVDKAFREYQQRVAEEVGPEREQEIRYAGEACDVDYHDSKGNLKTKTVNKATGTSVYARFFDDSSRMWSPVPEYNISTLTIIQNSCTQKLHAKGHLFLNEVYDMLGIPRSKEGAIAGWVQGEGDDYVDFGFMNMNDERVRDFLVGIEGGILLDFNVSGIIYDLI